jgi:hypothetical protein
MAQLNAKLSEEQLAALRSYAAQRRTPISWLIRDYLEYLLAGGKQLLPAYDHGPTSAELAEVAQRGGSFDWLAQEPDLYSATDGEPV